MEITRADFVGVPSTDFDRTMAFYVDTLGLRRDEHSRSEFWVAEARAELEAKGVEFAGEIFDTGVCHFAFFSDPDGNRLALHNRYKPYE